MYIIMFSNSPKTTTLFSSMLASSTHQVDIVEELSGSEDKINCPLIIIYDRAYEPTLGLCNYLHAIDSTMNMMVIVPGLDEQQINALYAAGAHSVVTGSLRAQEVLGAIQDERHNWWQPLDTPFVHSV